MRSEADTDKSTDQNKQRDGSGELRSNKQPLKWGRFKKDNALTDFSQKMQLIMKKVVSDEIKRVQDQVKN